MGTKEFGEFLRDCRRSASLSQAELAKLCGMSNKTISEYEAGADSLTPQADAVVRLALALKREPKEWLIKAGLVYDEREVEQARGKFIRHESRKERYSIPDTLAELRTVQRPTVRAIYIAEPGRSHFSEDHFTLISNIMDRRWKCQLREARSFGEMTDALITTQGLQDHCHVALNALQTLGRTGKNLQFIPYPGLKRKLNGIILKRGLTKVTWKDLRDKTKSIYAVTIQGEAGDEYLKSICGYNVNEGDIISVEKFDLRRLTNQLDQALQQVSGRPIVLCAAENICHRLLLNYLDHRFQLLADPADEEQNHMLPEFRLGMYVRAEDRGWGAHLLEAQEVAFRLAPERMAAFYARHLSVSVPLNSPFNHGFSFARLACEQKDYFSEYFIAELERRLEADIDEVTSFAKKDYGAVIGYIMEGVKTRVLPEKLEVVRSKLDEILTLLSAED
jgi:transcriptional regulator with XRE-family HTH domain